METPPIDHLFTFVKTHFRDQMLCCLPVLSWGFVFLPISILWEKTTARQQMFLVLFTASDGRAKPGLWSALQTEPEVISEPGRRRSGSAGRGNPLSWWCSGDTVGNGQQRWASLRYCRRSPRGLHHLIKHRFWCETWRFAGLWMYRNAKILSKQFE